MSARSMAFEVDEATLKQVAEDERIDLEQLRARVNEGTVVVMGGGNVQPLGIGLGLRTKINANLGTSPDYPDVENELNKVRAAVAVGADTVMDLSTGGDIDAIRRRIREECPVLLGVVPVYQAIIEAEARYGDTMKMPGEMLLEIIKRQAEDGVDFMTLHCGVTRETVAALRSSPRLGGIVSRGGSMLAAWMTRNNAENPLYERYDEVLDILREHGVAISLGDGLRPGAIADATDAGQVAETRVLGELVLRAREAGVQAFVEGPGHVPMDQIEANVVLEKRLCHNAPFYVLGPLVTDIAPGYDHITGAIGGAICAAAGADYLCYVTPAEHLGLPTVQDVIEGTIASRLAAHAADIIKGVPGARERDDAMSEARRALDWAAMERLALDPGRVRATRGDRPTKDDRACSMCGRFCSVRANMIVEEDSSEGDAG
ncbi:MAG: phosphomethylpyrimidine synthase ThiC [Armatimonadetes bacterium]|nr:phosphomethylpyrimidine synthase ThiC [Armatimonadota bacterium]